MTGARCTTGRILVMQAVAASLGRSRPRLLKNKKTFGH